MRYIWVSDRERRVRAGALSREDAIEIFDAAVRGAGGQGFKPAGGMMPAVHKSATDFLRNAEAVYFARRKKAADCDSDQRAGLIDRIVDSPHADEM
jgi:hypothetical protein